MAACARCGRPVAVARPSCLYCGAPVDAPEPAAAPAETPAPEEPAPGEERVLLVGELGDADPDRLAAHLSVSKLEAQQRVRRRGPELLRVRPAAGADEECRALEALGARVQALAEAGVRRAAEPWRAVGGRQRSDGGLRLRGASGERALDRGETLLVVQGRIQREYQPRAEKRLRTATLEQGYRFHLHLLRDEIPIELDPGAFEFDGESGAGSSLLRLRGWLEQLAAEAPADDRFRFLPAALGPEEPAEGGALAATTGLRRRSGGEESLILDNLRQFRFYSAWRGAWERASSD